VKSIFLFFILFWGWSVRGSVGVVCGPVRSWSADPVRCGSPRTGGQCFGSPSSCGGIINEEKSSLLKLVE